MAKAPIRGRLETALALLRLPGVGPVALRKFLMALRQAELPVESVWSGEGRRAIEAAGLVAPDLVPDSDDGEIIARLEKKGIRCLFPTHDADLPQLEFLRQYIPPVLFAHGATSLLERPSVGFCGSRAVTQRGLEVATDIAEQAAQAQINVVSGGARGVDTAAHAKALRVGGTTTIVLAEGILSWSMKTDVRAVYDPKRTLVVSEYPPTARWLIGRAMQRNLTICALSHALVLIEARSTGGTFAAGETALRIKMPLFCVVYANKLEENDGNRILLEKGAFPMKCNSSTMRANTEALFRSVRERFLRGAGLTPPPPSVGS